MHRSRQTRSLADLAEAVQANEMNAGVNYPYSWETTLCDPW